MVLRTLTRADDYDTECPLFTFTLSNAELNPFDLAGCTVRSTWRPEAVPPDHVEGDTDAALHASITFDPDGTVTASDGLVLPDGLTALDGTLLLVADRDTTAGMPLGTVLKGDVQVTAATGKVRTVHIAETITTRDGMTVTAP